MNLGARVELYVTSTRGNALGREDKVIIRVGKEIATLTAGEWSALIRMPVKTSELVIPS
jgi:hypothetical protein